MRLAIFVALIFGGATSGFAQFPPGQQGSRNMTIVAHMPLGGAEPVAPGTTAANPNAAPRQTNPNDALARLGSKTADITMEQELSRPYVYICHRFSPTGFWIINIKDPSKPKVLYDWVMENPDLHRGSQALGPMYAKSKGRYYFLQSFQFAEGGPDVDLNAIVFDVTGLPDTSKVREVARIREPLIPAAHTKTSLTNIPAARP
jgi:hypothetical protein